MTLLKDFKSPTLSVAEKFVHRQKVWNSPRFSYAFDESTVEISALHYPCGPYWIRLLRPSGYLCRKTWHQISDKMDFRESRRIEDQARKNSLTLLNAPSQNVYNLQRRVAGVLPVRVDVPRAGKSYKFVRPLVLEEETKVTFQYKSK